MTTYTSTGGLHYLPSIVANTRYIKERTFRDSSRLTEEEMEWAQQLARDAAHCDDSAGAIEAELYSRVIQKFDPLWEYNILVDTHG